jgi:WD40 repeat protein
VVVRGCNGFQCQFSADGQRLSGYRDPVLGVYEIAYSSVLRRLYVPPGDQGGAWGIDVSPDGKLVAGADTDGLRLLDFVTGREIEFRPFYGCRSVLFTPDGSGLLACGPAGLARWPIERVTATGEVRLGPRDSIQDGIQFSYASLSADGRWVAAANKPAGCVGVYEVNNSTNRFALTNHPFTDHVALSPDGRWAASGTWNGRGVRIWDLPSRRIAKELPVASCTVTFSPDSRLLVTGSQRYQVWEAGTWRELYRPTGKGAVANPSAFSPGGGVLAVVKDLNVVQLLEAATGRVLAELQAPGSTPVFGLRFRPDGTALLALEWSREIQVWDLRRLRAELAALHLDWEAPPYPAEK